METKQEKRRVRALFGVLAGLISASFGLGMAFEHSIFSEGIDDLVVLGSLILATLSAIFIFSATRMERLVLTLIPKEKEAP